MPNRIAMCLAFAACATLQGPARADADTVNAKVDALFAEWDSTVTPGCSLGVSKDGRIVQERGYGMANLEHGVPNSADTVFHIASVSKQFTAAAIAMLVLEGKVSPSDSIRKHLPEMPRFDHDITVDQIVRHTSGLRDHSEILELSGWRYYQDLVTTEDALSVLVKQKSLLFTPGSRYHYSNTNYFLMGEIVQRVTGKTLRQFADERIFKPLEMQDSHFRDHFPEVVRNFASGYGREGDAFVTSLTHFSIVGYSTLLTTVGDLMKWEENFYTGQVGGKALVDLMLSKSHFSDGKPNKYTYGIVVDDHRGLQTVEHSGGDAGYASHLVRFPQKHLSVAVLCNVNSADARNLAMGTAEIHLGLEPEVKPAETPGTPPVAAKVSEGELRSKVGRYLNAEAEKAINVEFADGRLHSVSGDDRRALTPLSSQRYSMSEGRWVLEFPKGRGVPAELTLYDRYHPSQVLQRVPDFNPDAAALAPYAGTYVSEEIEAPFHILVVEGRPVLRSIKFKAILTPVTKELFTAGWANVAFERDAAGRVTGFRYGTRNEPMATFTKRK